MVVLLFDSSVPSFLCQVKGLVARMVTVKDAESATALQVVADNKQWWWTTSSRPGRSSGRAVCADASLSYRSTRSAARYHPRAENYWSL